MRRARRIVAVQHLEPGERLGPSHLELREFDVPDPKNGELVVDVCYLSVDPYLRGVLAAVQVPGFPPQFALGAPLESYGVGRVVDSRVDCFREGDIVVGSLPWAERAVTVPKVGINEAASLQHLSPYISDLPNALGIQGLTGMNAYFGMTEVGRVKPGERVVVSGAAGAIGSVAAQVARILGATVIGLAGTEEKRRILVEELGLQHALDYRSDSFEEELSEICPGGPDLYFDNVGGPISQTIMWLMHKPARIVECGQISTLETSGWLVDIFPIHMNQLTLTSVLGSAYREFFPGAISQLGAWLAAGKISSLRSITEGLEAAPSALAGLFTGANIGKTLIHVQD
jgi:NADPH-dependent curcumin reductase CurA